MESKGSDRGSSYDEINSKGSGSRVVSEDKPDLDKCSSSVMSDEETAHQYSKMTLRPRRKSMRHLTGGKTLVNGAAKKLGVPTLEIINDEIYTEALEKKIVL